MNVYLVVVIDLSIWLKCSEETRVPLRRKKTLEQQLQLQSFGTPY